MVFFQLILLVVGVVLIARLVTMILGGGSTPKRPCGVHKWKPNDKNIFECSICGFVAGSHKTSHGEY